MHGHLLYYIIFFVMFLVMLYIAITKKDPDENRVLALYCALSTVLIYHRQYDMFILIIPLFYVCYYAFPAALTGKRWIRVLVLGVSALGTGCIVYGNWVFQLLNVTIEYGMGQTVFYGLSIIGVYLMCGVLLYDTIKAVKYY